MNARPIRFAAAGVLAVTTLLAAATPARADNDDWRWRRHEWREHHWHQAYRPYVYAPPPVYYAPPPVYYAPPPVYYRNGW